MEEAMHSSIELICLELSVLLFIAHVVCQAVLAQGEFGQPFLFSPRDKQPAAKGVVVGRATRALHNFVENYGAFIAMDLALVATGHTGGWARRCGSSRASSICRSILPAFPSCAPRSGAFRSSGC